MALLALHDRPFETSGPPGGGLACRAGAPPRGGPRPFEIPLAKIHPVQGRTFGLPQGGPWGDPLTPLEGGWHGKARGALGAEVRQSVQAREAQEQPCRCSQPQPPPHSAAGPAAPACAREVESPPDGGATGLVFRCAYALVLHVHTTLLLIMTDYLGQVARQVAGWLAGQVARPEAGPGGPKLPLARIRPIFGLPQDEPWGDPLTPLEGGWHGEARGASGLRLDRSSSPGSPGAALPLLAAAAAAALCWACSAGLRPGGGAAAGRQRHRASLPLRRCASAFLCSRLVPRSHYSRNNKDSLP
eukprot:SM000071S21061  [mRNA]  locus=s71:100709:106497:+ [translate_table: standard]